MYAISYTVRGREKPWQKLWPKEDRDKPKVHYKFYLTIKAAHDAASHPPPAWETWEIRKVIFSGPIISFKRERDEDDADQR